MNASMNYSQVAWKELEHSQNSLRVACDHLIETLTQGFLCLNVTRDQLARLITDQGLFFTNTV